MNKVSFEEIGAVAATFFAQKEVKAGQVVKMTGNGQVGPCSTGDKFCGVALSNEKSCRFSFSVQYPLPHFHLFF